MEINIFFRGENLVLPRTSLIKHSFLFPYSKWPLEQESTPNNTLCIFVCFYMHSDDIPRGGESKYDIIYMRHTYIAWDTLKTYQRCGVVWCGDSGVCNWKCSPGLCSGCWSCSFLTMGNWLPRDAAPAAQGSTCTEIITGNLAYGKFQTFLSNKSIAISGNYIF